ncbi:hypothetical protein Tco_0143415 [Tanacetum coccineum]
MRLPERSPKRLPENSTTMFRMPSGYLRRHYCITDGLEECEFENTCNNDKNLSEIKLEYEEDELIVMVVKVLHELDCRMVVKEIEDGLLEEMEVSHFRKEVMILEWKEKFGWWFEQDIDGESEDDNKKKLVMVNEEGWMS